MYGDFHTSLLVADAQNARCRQNRYLTLPNKCVFTYPQGNVNIVSDHSFSDQPPHYLVTIPLHLHACISFLFSCFFSWSVIFTYMESNSSQHRLKIILHPVCFPILLTHKVLTSCISKEGNS